MADAMTISQLAKATGVPVSTIRFYERRGMIRPASRSSGNYRLYERAAAERLTFIGAAQAGGLRLPEIKAILSLETGRVTCARADQLVAGRLVALREQMLRLRQLERVLIKIRRACAAQPADALFQPAEPFVLRKWLRRT